MNYTLKEKKYIEERISLGTWGMFILIGILLVAIGIVGFGAVFTWETFKWITSLFN